MDYRTRLKINFSVNNTKEVDTLMIRTYTKGTIIKLFAKSRKNAEDQTTMAKEENESKQVTVTQPIVLKPALPKAK
tara:strand:+ start:805 stop:1032 length:228 start_codon:yes stop_codon:yes gene_type:complete